jgi:molybdopterin-guanine dinucleotide biosynthesis protein
VALLLTRVYGSGKTTVMEEIGTVFEERGTPYAALDVLGRLGWD